MTQTSQAIPETQYAIQLIGPSQLRLNTEKEVFKPGPYQILAKIEAVGLCFSDLKLLKQFTEHVRKSEIVSGLPPEVLAEIPSYVPGEKPTVPGHEVVCRIVAIGDKVAQHKLGERCLVQTDYRDLHTAKSNAAFGYNFEGGLQEYVLMDERVMIDPTSGERFLIPVKEDLSASAVCLVEPWACVEDSYVNLERQSIKAGGQLLVVADAGYRIVELDDSFSPDGPPASISAVCEEESQLLALDSFGLETMGMENLEALPNEAFDDIVYFGANAETINVLNDKLAPRGILNIVTGGKEIGAPVSVGIGRVHYGMTRWIGTTGKSAAEAYKNIPKIGEIRAGEKVVVIGAGGPMGQMHVIRDLCTGKHGVAVVAADVDDSRLASLMEKAQPLAEANKVELRAINTKANPLTEKFTYIAVMAPVGPLVADAIKNLTGEGCLINVFAGIPATVKQDMDLDTYIANRCFMFGTSGSVIEDMRIVLRKVEQNTLDTNCSVDAISGMAGAADGIAAVENRTLAGKIIVYPMLHDVGLTPLTQLKDTFPTVAAKLENGQWTKAAEQELLRVAAK